LRLPRLSTAFPYTTLFRSQWRLHRGARHLERVDGFLLRLARDDLQIARLLLVELVEQMPGAQRELRGVDPGRGRDGEREKHPRQDRKSTRLNSSHVKISYA